MSKGKEEEDDITGIRPDVEIKDNDEDRVMKQGK